MSDLPTALWVEAKLRELDLNAIPYYYIQKGNYHSGLVMVKFDIRSGQCCLQTQQRNFMSDKMEWVDALGKEEISEQEADEYIQRAISRDPDLWVIEVEQGGNPFIVGE